MYAIFILFALPIMSLRSTREAATRDSRIPTTNSEEVRQEFIYIFLFVLGLIRMIRMIRMIGMIGMIRMDD